MISPADLVRLKKSYIRKLRKKHNCKVHTGVLRVIEVSNKNCVLDKSVILSDRDYLNLREVPVRELVMHRKFKLISRSKMLNEKLKITKKMLKEIMN